MNIKYIAVFGVGLFGLVGCASTAMKTVFGQTDSFRSKLEAGCADESSCHKLVIEARSRKANCQSNTIGYIRCSDAKVDLITAKELLQEKLDKKKERIAAQTKKEEEQKRKEQERQELRKKALEMQKLQAQKEQERLGALSQTQKSEKMWKSLDVSKCGDKGDAPTCAALNTYINLFPESKYIVEAKIAYSRGMEIQRQTRAERQKDKVKIKYVSVAPSKDKSEQNKNKKDTEEKHAKCCNGMIDKSCSCEGGAGCCFQKGGVCGCE